MDFGTRSLIRYALAEDIGRGDITTNLVIDKDLTARAVVWVKESCCIAGLDVVEEVFREVNPSLTVRHWVQDGQDVIGPKAVCEIFGPARSILSAERTALNFLARMTGIATKTREARLLLEGAGAKLLDTRKTTPGWRALEKRAVRMGGGMNHRFGLDDMVLIKDNHIALAGGVGLAIERVRQGCGIAPKIEVEVDNLDQLRIAVNHQVDMILLDNMDLDTMRRAVEIVNRRIPLEASGNMTMERLVDVARTGVDYISMGALTHSATSIDVGLDVRFQAAND